MFKELLNKQVVCNDVALLQFMYPNFRVVKTTFEIYPEEPFIWVGDSKYISKIHKRTELHIIVASTGEYDLTDMKTLIQLAYMKHNKYRLVPMKDKMTDKIMKDENGNTVYEKDQYGEPKKELAIPKYIDDLIKQWENKNAGKSTLSKDFIYNWKYLWVNGEIADKEIQSSKIYLDLLNQINNPMMFIKIYLQGISDGLSPYLNRSLTKFFSDSIIKTSKERKTKSQDEQVIAKSGWEVKVRNNFYNSYSTKLTDATHELIDTGYYIDDKDLQFLTYVISIMMSNVI